MIIVFSNVLNVEYSTVKYSTGDNVTASRVGKNDYEQDYLLSIEILCYLMFLLSIMFKRIRKI